MEVTTEIKNFLNLIWAMSADQIAIISLAITLLLFVLGKRAENKIKIYETRKEEYRKLIDFFQKMFASVDKKDVQKQVNDPKMKQQFFDIGASLAIFGSKNLYKTYCFYRWLAIDETLQKNRWYNKEMVMYALGEMYQIMRKEIGLNRDLVPVDVPDVLAFYINDFTKPEFKKKFYKYHFNKFCLKSAIFWGKIEEFVPLVWIQNFLIKPVFFSLFCVIRFPIRLFIITPIHQIKQKIRAN